MKDARSGQHSCPLVYISGTSRLPDAVTLARSILEYWTVIQDIITGLHLSLLKMEVETSRHNRHQWRKVALRLYGKWLGFVPACKHLQLPGLQIASVLGVNTREVEWDVYGDE